jgi:UDP-glucose 4-epimerase
MKKILITGGNGFLGKNLGLKLKGEYKVYLASRNQKNNQAASLITGCESVPLDVSNIESVRDIIAYCKPDIIIHGAATKFVDLSEKFPMETIDVNVVGSQNVARVAIEKNIECVIGISTDKASPPIRNTYGLSKAMMEKIFCLTNKKTDTKFSCVRYGNVAWSTGSVLPIWKQMLETTGVIGTTGPEMRRFFFTVDDAVNLVLTALNNQSIVEGKILATKMKSAQIQTILDVWVSRLGGSWKKIEGRPGERIDEFLIGESELPFCEEITLNGNGYFLIHQNQKVEFPIKEIFSSANAERLTDEEILEIIKNYPKNT